LTREVHVDGGVFFDKEVLWPHEGGAGPNESAIHFMFQTMSDEVSAFLPQAMAVGNAAFRATCKVQMTVDTIDGVLELPWITISSKQYMSAVQPVHDECCHPSLVQRPGGMAESRDILRSNIHGRIYANLCVRWSDISLISLSTLQNQG